MSAFRQGSDFSQAHRIPEREIGVSAPGWSMATQTWEPCSGYHRYSERAAFPVALMIPERRDCEGERRSWRIAIHRCDAMAHNFVAFFPRMSQAPRRGVESEMHSAVLRFTFGKAIATIGRYG
jgi:hypothetical protein